MVEFVSWFGVAVIALFALVGFVGVVATSALTVARRVRHVPPPARVDEPQRVAA
ncbi:hypothetical protein G5V58_16065 [Nocardioides anomalus]|uniref:Uncharacterized protein n=1 Tax=Nocardioides anomalus TaxID=2712223 RepID=A0A6G6WG03_9ACTN|nr:hypothetical protein [Nocardioides anomalus]QIG44087.1 hypothetical protein G5V58_16065 [Nocardioides anomalus]